jgi:hypothetical protein
MSKVRARVPAVQPLEWRVSAVPHHGAGRHGGDLLQGESLGRDRALRGSGCGDGQAQRGVAREGQSPPPGVPHSLRMSQPTPARVSTGTDTSTKHPVIFNVPPD